ncbi:MAG: hypothetical protein KGS72_02520 [Cyanobacteria bacterium REEB67]|nr:hypothetical protein [Cyanobacteria bacterium REEB67]
MHSKFFAGRAAFANFAALATTTLCLILNVSLPASLAAGAESFTGYLVDKSCAAMIKNDHLDPTKRLKDHTRACSLEPSCCEAGYAVYSGGKWIDLDAAGSALAQKLIRASKKDKAHMCKITGEFKRNEFHATAVTEVN